MHRHLGEVDGHLLDEQVLNLLLLRKRTHAHVRGIEAIFSQLHRVV